MNTTATHIITYTPHHQHQQHYDYYSPFPSLHPNPTNDYYYHHEHQGNEDQWWGGWLGGWGGWNQEEENHLNSHNNHHHRQTNNNNNNNNNKISISSTTTTTPASTTTPTTSTTTTTATTTTPSSSIIPPFLHTPMHPHLLQQQQQQYDHNNNVTWLLDLGVPHHWLVNHASTRVPSELHLVVALILTTIGLLGTAGNAVVVWVFTRFRRFRSPANTFIVNLAASDLITSLLHSMAAYSSFKRRWSFGKIGCSIYGGGVGLLGLVSIVTLAWIAVERLIVIRTSSASSKRRITRRAARKLILAIWVYCSALALPPFFGWSAYVPEGLMTSCSWDYMSRTSSNRAYYVYLLVGGFVLPVCTIVCCYSYILLALFRHSRLLLSHATQHRSTTTSTRRTDLRTAQMVLTLILLFTISWSPYATVSFIGQFGDISLINPWVSALPALFAKASVIYNPIVYGMSHPHFRSSLQHLFTSVATSSQHPMHYKPSNALRHVSVNSVVALPGDSPHRTCQSEVLPLPRYLAVSSKETRHINSGASWSHLLGPAVDLTTSPPAVPSKNSGDGANLSEPDLMRHDDRIIPAHCVTNGTYRREKRRFLRSALFCSESSLERYQKQGSSIHSSKGHHHHQQELRVCGGGGGGGLLPTTTPNCVLEQTGPGTWDHVALLTPSLPLNADARIHSIGSCSFDRHKPAAMSTICSRSPRLSLARLTALSREHRHANCCQCAAGDLAQTVTVATINNTRRRSSTIHVCLRGNLHQYLDL